MTRIIRIGHSRNDSNCQQGRSSSHACFYDSRGVASLTQETQAWQNSAIPGSMPRAAKPVFEGWSHAAVIVRPVIAMVCEEAYSRAAAGRANLS